MLNRAPGDLTPSECDLLHGRTIRPPRDPARQGEPSGRAARADEEVRLADLGRGCQVCPGSEPPVRLLGQAVRQVDRRVDGLGKAEPMLQDQAREIARVDATRQIMASGYGRVRPRVVHKA